MRIRRKSSGHERMQDPECSGRNRPPSAADVNASPLKPGQPLVGPVKPPYYTEREQHEYDNPMSESGTVSNVKTTGKSYFEQFEKVVAFPFQIEGWNYMYTG